MKYRMISTEATKTQPAIVAPAHMFHFEVSQKQVTDWMLLFGQHVPLTPNLPKKMEDRIFRIRLIDEELGELANALYEDGGDLVEAADAIADLLYVVLGTATALGIHNIAEIFEEVHQSNVSKFWTLPEIEKLKDTTEGWEKLFNISKRDLEGKVKFPMSDRLFVVKNIEGKVLKSPSFTPPNIKPLLQLPV